MGNLQMNLILSIIYYDINYYSIGFGIAQRLAEEGAKVVISSRKQKNVDQAVQKLTSSGLIIHGTVCHVSKAEDRKKLFAEASFISHSLKNLILLCNHYRL